MQCEAEICIYNQGKHCTILGITLDNIGMCDSFELVALETDFLNAEKERQLSEKND